MQRIMIIGGPGSGKSTVARRLGAATGLPVVHIDPMFWAPGWVQRSVDETYAMIEQAVRGPAWIFEGNNTPTLAMRAERADLILFLDLPRRLRMWRLVKRTLRYLGRTRPDMAPGCPERFDIAFFRFAWAYDDGGRLRARAFCTQWQGRRKVLRLTSPEAVEAFLKTCEG